MASESRLIPNKRNFLILAGAFLCLRLLMAVSLPLTPQEAYYWVYSLYPDLSYYDHPPLVAYTILFSTELFGVSVLAVRLGALLYFTGFGIILFLLGRHLFNLQVAFWSVLLINLLPTYSITGLILTPDGPLLFFWTLSCLLSLKAVDGRRYAWHLGAGCSLGLALLSKYTAIFFPLSLFLFLLLSSEHRRHLRRLYPYAGLAAALLIFSPVLLWNHRHDWASFAFQSSERAAEMLGRVSIGELAGFLGSQMGILTPLVFLGMIGAMALGLRRFLHPGRWQERFLLTLGMPLLLFFTGVAALEWVKINWLIPGYAPIILLLVAYYQETLFKGKWIYRGYVKVLWITVGLFFILLHLWPFAPFIKVSGSLDTFSGWKELAVHLEQNQPERASAKAPFIFAWGHKTASELRFYLKGHPPVYAQTVLGKKALAYDFWFDPAPLIGRDALFVWSEFENFPEEKTGLLERHFEKVEKLQPFIVYRGPYPLRTFQVFGCYNYKGFTFTPP